MARMMAVRFSSNTSARQSACRSDRRDRVSTRPSAWCPPPLVLRAAPRASEPEKRVLP
ncbi:MAG: hypothetical protein H6Q08_1983, partial [Acidobacteria bacterium]|nr:hypothetical protein [Acidobacteriota bacterium]